MQIDFKITSEADGKLHMSVSKAYDVVMTTLPAPATKSPYPNVKHILDKLGQAAIGRDERLLVEFECGGYTEIIGNDVIMKAREEMGLNELS